MLPDSSRYQDVNVFMCKFHSCYVKRKRVDVQSMSSGSTNGRVYMLFSVCLGTLDWECRLRLMAY